MDAHARLIWMFVAAPVGLVAAGCVVVFLVLVLVRRARRWRFLTLAGVLLVTWPGVYGICAPRVMGRYLVVFPDPYRMQVKKGERAYVFVRKRNDLTDADYTVRVTLDQRPRAPRGENDYLFFVQNAPVEGLEAVIPPGRLFIMGDNRNDSLDSEHWGCLDEKRVLGRAFTLYWPPGRARSLGGG